MALLFLTFQMIIEITVLKAIIARPIAKAIILAISSKKGFKSAYYFKVYEQYICMIVMITKKSFSIVILSIIIMKL